MARQTSVMAPTTFFTTEGFDYATRVALGSSAYGMAEVGEVLAAVDAITDGDADSWFDTWTATAERIRGIAESAEAAGHRASACRAYLRSSNYAGVAFFYVLATKDPSRSLSAWRRHRDSFDRAMALWPTPVEHVAIPYESTRLHGYFWSAGAGRAPTIILNNGSDGPVVDMISAGVVDALARGYHAVTFDGPGQGYALYEQNMAFRYDWEAVITPVVDYLLGRDDVDGSRLVLSGLSQGGYWVLRAAAFEHRLAGVVADPGVVRVGDSWTAHLPQQMLDLIDSGQGATFDEYMNQAIASTPELKLILPKRMEPYRNDSMSAIITDLRTHWDLTTVAGQITTPILITAPDDEQFWPGQSQQLFDLVTHAHKVLVPFTQAEGAAGHCEPMAPQLRAQRIFDWIDDVLAHSA